MPPQRVIIGTVLSLDFVFAVVGLITVVAAAIGSASSSSLLGGLVPFGSGSLQIVTKRVHRAVGLQAVAR